MRTCSKCGEQLINIDTAIGLESTRLLCNPCATAPPPGKRVKPLTEWQTKPRRLPFRHNAPRVEHAELLHNSKPGERSR
jgi:hypothetical protein